jgi:pimeloyl-ACP methyl ester carboxylesterase
MHVVHASADGGGASRHCVVMLPAAFCEPEDFVREGFARIANQRAPAIELLFAQPERRHLTDRAWLARLHEEIVLPARARGAGVWLGGISLGGFFALRYAERHAAELEGMCLIAPYLGSRLVTDEIERAGGLRGWQSGAPAAEEDDERRIWQFLDRYDDRRLTLHLGFGAEDRFSGRHRLLGAALPAANVDTVPGGHDWPTWRHLWENFINRRIARIA